MRFLFFLMAFPIMMMSFFEVADVVPLSQASLLVDGTEIELTETQQADLNEQVALLFEDSRTMPCYCVSLHDEFVQKLETGTYICLNFLSPLDVNGLPFDQLVFELDCEAESVTLVRGNHGIFQGRCLSVNLNGTPMQDLCDFVDSLDLTESTPIEDGEEIDDQNEAVDVGENEEQTGEEENVAENLNEENFNEENANEENLEDEKLIEETTNEEESN